MGLGRGIGHAMVTMAAQMLTVLLKYNLGHFQLCFPELVAVQSAATFPVPRTVLAQRHSLTMEHSLH